MLPLEKIYTAASRSTILKYASTLERMMSEYNINTTLRRAHFLAQLAHESCELKYTEENLKYSASRLMQIFPRYFRTSSEAQAAAYNPERIANTVYANRMGNGDFASGDGYTFRGHGLIQLTGRSNYEAFVKHLKSLPSSRLDSETVAIINGGSPSHPCHDIAASISPLISMPELAVRSACWFWQKNGINEIADQGESDKVITAVTRKVNGGTNGLSQRKIYFYRALVVFKNI